MIVRIQIHCRSPQPFWFPWHANILRSPRATPGHSPSALLDGAGAANVAIHLHLAVGQGALVALGAEDIVGHPMDSILMTKTSRKNP